MSTLVFGTQVCVAVRPGVGLDFLFCVSLWASKSNSFMEPGAPQPVAQKQLWKRERLEEHWRKYNSSQKPEPKKHRGGAARQRRKRALEQNIFRFSFFFPITLDVSKFNFKGSTWQTETKNIYEIKSMNSCKKRAKNETKL